LGRKRKKLLYPGSSRAKAKRQQAPIQQIGHQHPLGPTFGADEFPFWRFKVANRGHFWVTGENATRIPVAKMEKFFI
jgi:hypothetical protein